MMKILRMTALLAFCAYEFSFAAYLSQELFIINWGEEPNQLKMEITSISDNSTPDDPYDDEVTAGAGPSDAFVDADGNIIFSSYEFGQLKGFDSQGNLRFDFSLASPQYNSEIFTGSVAAIYVDGDAHLFVLSAPNNGSVSVVDYNGDIISTLYPFLDSSGVTISLLSWSYDGKIFFHDSGRGWRAYLGGDFENWGTPGFLAMNGSFYAAKAFTLDAKTPTDSIKFNKYESPDSTGVAHSRELKTIIYPSMNLYSASLLNALDGSFLYNFVCVDDYSSFEVWVHDLDYEVKFRIELEAVDEDLGWFIPPFVSSDGSIYEFRSLNDGLHVVKWTKE